MTYVRLAPTSTGSNSGSITGASVHAALSDNSDSTFVTYDYGEASLLGFADLTLPSGAQLVFAQLMARCAKNGTAAARLDTNLNVNGNQSAQTAVTGTLPAEMGGAARGYGAITDAGVDAAIGGISCGSLSQLIVYEASIRVLYYVKPTVTVTAPTGTVTTNEVTVEWSSVFDPDAVGPYSYEVKIFSAAQYGAGGFNPSSSTPTLFTSFASGQSSVLFANSSLADGNYRAYVRVAAANATDLWSDWDYEAFTVDAPNPGVPTLTVTGENSNGRVKLEVDDTSGDTGTNYFHVQRSDDGGTTFVDVRTTLGSGFIATSGPKVTLYDYEAPNGSTVSYRARAFNSTYSTYSDWQSGSGGWSSASWWLKHNSKPSLNLELGIVRSVPGFEVAANQTVHKVLGSSRVVVVSDTAGPVTGSIVVLTEDTAERQALMNTLDLQVPMLLQAPVSSDEPERWVVFGDRSSTPLADKSWVHANDEVLPWTEVDRPSGALEE